MLQIKIYDFCADTLDYEVFYMEMEKEEFIKQLCEQLSEAKYELDKIEMKNGVTVLYMYEDRNSPLRNPPIEFRIKKLNTTSLNKVVEFSKKMISGEN